MERALTRVGLGKPWLAMKRAGFNGVKSLLQTALPPDLKGALDLELDPRMTDLKEFKRYIGDRVFDTDFWTRACMEPRHITDEETPYELAASTLIDFPEKHMRHFTTDKVARAAASGKPLHKEGKHRVFVEERAPRYLWHATRLGGLRPGRLEKLPTWVTRLG
jgi:hypothetical protein